MTPKKEGQSPHYFVYRPYVLGGHHGKDPTFKGSEGDSWQSDVASQLCGSELRRVFAVRRLWYTPHGLSWRDTRRTLTLDLAGLAVDLHLTHSSFGVALLGQLYMTPLDFKVDLLGLTTLLSRLPDLIRLHFDFT